MKASFLSVLILSTCATALSDSINPDFPRCFSALIGADSDSNGEVKVNEFLPFLKLYGPPGCFQESSLTLEQISVFNSMACLCQLRTNNTDCCLQDRAFLNNTGAGVNDTPTSEELNYLDTICTVAAKTIHAQCPQLFVPTPSPVSPTLPPIAVTPSPVSPTLSPIAVTPPPAPSPTGPQSPSGPQSPINGTQSSSGPQSPSAQSPSAPQSPTGPLSPTTTGNNTGNGTHTAPTKPFHRPTAAHHPSHAPVISPAPKPTKGHNTTQPSLMPSLAPSAFNFSNVTDNITSVNATNTNGGSGDEIPWWAWLLLALLLLFLLLCCIILCCCCCRRRDEKEEEGLVAGDEEGDEARAIGDDDDDDEEGNAKYRDGVPGEDDEANNRFTRGSGVLPGEEGFDNEGVNLNSVGGRGNRGNGNGGDGQTFEPYDSNGNYRRGGDGEGDGDGSRYKGDWDRLNRGGDGDDGDDAYRNYPGGKRGPGEDGENAHGVSLRPTETRSNQHKKDNDDDGADYPGTMDGYNPYDGGAHYDPHDPYGNGYNRSSRDKNGSDDWKNKFQRGEKDGNDDAANKKVREEKPLGPGEIWGVLGEDDGQRSGDKWGPLWVYEKTLDSLKNAEAKGDLDHSSDEEE